MIHNYPLRIALFFFTVTTGLYVSFVLLAGTAYYNYCSVIALLFGAAFSTSVFKNFHSRRYFVRVKQHLPEYQENIVPVSFIIVFTNGLLGFIGLYLIYEKVNFSNLPDLKNTLVISSGFGIIIAQIGGWILQSFLINLLSVFYGGRNNPKIFFNLVGFAYVGFLLTAIFSIILNPLILPDQMTPEELNEIIFASYWHIISGKVGEFIVLTIIIYGILYIENTNVMKALVISITPSFLLLVFNMLFQNIF